MVLDRQARLAPNCGLIQIYLRSFDVVVVVAVLVRVCIPFLLRRRGPGLRTTRAGGLLGATGGPRVH